VDKGGKKIGRDQKLAHVAVEKKRSREKVGPAARSTVKKGLRTGETGREPRATTIERLEKKGSTALTGKQRCIVIKSGTKAPFQLWLKPSLRKVMEKKRIKKLQEKSKDRV